MPRQKSPPQRVLKPLWRMGWVGYTAAAVLAALIVAHASGVDIWYQILSAITWTLGGEPMIWFAGRLSLVLLLLASNGASIIESAVLLTAMKIASRRFSWWHFAYVAAIGSLYPLLMTDTVFVWLRPSTFSMEAFEWQFRYALWIGLGLLFVPVVIWTRSFLITASALVCAVCVLVAQGDDPVFYIEFGRLGITLSTIVGWMALLSGSLTWAIIDRKRYRPENSCPVCGYTRTGLPANAPCPECGEAAETDPTRAL